MIFRLTIDFDSNNNEMFKGMTKEKIVEYIEAMQPKDDSVSLVSIKPIESTKCPGKEVCRTRSGSCFDCIRSISDLENYKDNFRPRLITS